ncbi:MAG: FIST N-terminal domain-containing protein [Promethearchaeota archaeon]
MIEASVGLSTDYNSLRAGKEAVKLALKDLSGKPNLAIIGIDTCSSKLYNFEEVLKGIRSEIPDVPLIGGGSVGIIINDDIAIRSVGIMLLSGDFNVIKPQIWHRARKNYEQIGQRMIQTYSPYLGQTENELLLLFASGYRVPSDVLAQQKRFDSWGARVFSSLVSRVFWNNMKKFAEEGKGFPVTQELIDILVENKINCPIVGTQVGDLTGEIAYEFFNNQVSYDSIISCLLSSDHVKFGTGFSAGVVCTGKKFKITKNVGPFLLGINKKKALDGLLEILGYERDVLKELGYQGYVNFLSLMGLSDNGETHPYIAVTNPIYDSIFTVLPPKRVNKNIEIEICEATGELILESAKDAVKMAKESVKVPKFLIFFDCSGRLSLLGDRIIDEIEIIRKEIGSDIPIFGFGSSGEIRNSPPGGYHLNNMSIVTIVGG